MVRYFRIIRSVETGDIEPDAATRPYFKVHYDIAMIRGTNIALNESLEKLRSAAMKASSSVQR